MNPFNITLGRSLKCLRVPKRLQNVVLLCWQDEKLVSYMYIVGRMKWELLGNIKQELSSLSNFYNHCTLYTVRTLYMYVHKNLNRYGTLNNRYSVPVLSLLLLVVGTHIYLQKTSACPVSLCTIQQTCSNCHSTHRT